MAYIKFFSELSIKDVPIVLCPEIIADAAVLVPGDGPVVLQADGLDPYVQHIIHRRQIRYHFPIGRDLRGGLDGIAKQYFPGDQFNFGGG